MSLRGSIVTVLASSLLIAYPVAWSAPILNAGWDTTDADASGYTDHIDRAGSFNVGGAYIYSLGDSAIFRITDIGVVGDTWTVYDGGISILVTSLQAFANGFGDNAQADGFWTDPAYSKGEVVLAAGDHSITVSGDGGANVFPAHYFARIDSAMPEPATLALLGIAFAAGLGLRRRS